MRKSRRTLAARAFLADGEHLIAVSGCSTPEAVETLTANPQLVVVTDRRLIVVRLGRFAAQKLKETVLDLPIAEIADVQLHSGNVVFGQDFRVVVTVTNGDAYCLANGGLGAYGRARVIAAALQDAMNRA